MECRLDWRICQRHRVSYTEPQDYDKGDYGVIARFVPEITLSRVRLCSLACIEPHMTCPRNMADRFETVCIMETNKGTVRRPNGYKTMPLAPPQSHRQRAAISRLPLDQKMVSAAQILNVDELITGQTATQLSTGLQGRQGAALKPLGWLILP